MDHENARKGREHSIFAKFESETGVGIYYQIRIQIFQIQILTEHGRWTAIW